jgi:hypothetical protein
MKIEKIYTYNIVVEVAVVSLQLLLIAVTFTKCHHTLTCSHCIDFWRHVLAVTSSSAERSLSRVRIIKSRLSTSIAYDWFESLTILAAESYVVCTLSIDENEITNAFAQCSRRLHQYLMKTSHMYIHCP